MRMEKEDDLGLSLSLNVSEHNHSHHQSLQLNLMPSWLQSSSSSLNNNSTLQRTPWVETFIPSGPEMDTCRGGKSSFLKGIDVNRVPVTVDGEEDACLSSPNSTVSSISGKRCERETTTGDDNDGENRNSDEEDGENSRKKLRLSKDQSAILEESFKEHNTLNPKQKMALAKQLGLRQRQVEVWFQNRRARTKLKQTEVDCEFLKRCCENLTEENRRLQKEVVELRALKLSPQFYMQMAPPTTLTMCPSCERVAPPPGAASSRPTVARAHPQAGSNISRPRPTFPWAAAPVPQRPFSSRP